MMMDTVVPKSWKKASRSDDAAMVTFVLARILSVQDPKGVGRDHAGSPMQLQVSVALVTLPSLCNCYSIDIHACSP